MEDGSKILYALIAQLDSSDRLLSDRSEVQVLFRVPKMPNFLDFLENSAFLLQIYGSRTNNLFLFRFVGFIRVLPVLFWKIVLSFACRCKPENIFAVQKTHLDCTDLRLRMRGSAFDHIFTVISNFRIMLNEKGDVSVKDYFNFEMLMKPADLPGFSAAPLKSIECYVN